MSDFDIDTFLPYMLNQAAERTSLEFQPTYKGRYGMLRTEWRVIFHIGKYGTMTAREIGVRAKTHKTKISRAVFDLCEKRYLKRETSETDRRQELLELTKLGQSVYLQLVSEAQSFEKKLTEKLGSKDVEKLKTILMQIM